MSKPKPQMTKPKFIFLFFVPEQNVGRNADNFRDFVPNGTF